MGETSRRLSYSIFHGENFGKTLTFIRLLWVCNIFSLSQFDKRSTVLNQQQQSGEA